MSEGRPLQATVLLDLIQDDEGSEWASGRKGWNMETFGMYELMLYYTY